MPTYEFRCRDCGEEFELLLPMSHEEMPLCPECNSENVEKLISSGGGVIFKGSGFYRTDYKGKNPSV